MTQVVNAGNADNAGLKTEDIIIEANGEKIRNDQDLVFIVNDLTVGDILKLKILRDGNEKTIDIKLLP